MVHNRSDPYENTPPPLKASKSVKKGRRWKIGPKGRSEEIIRTGSQQNKVGKKQQLM
jgi:hypothetical protein